MKLSHRVSMLACLMLVSASWTYGADQPAQEPAFPGLSGPLQATALPPETTDRTDHTAYHHPYSNNLALFLRDTESSWLGLAHGLKSIGIPFTVTTEIDEALAHEVMLVYPSLTGANTPPQLLLQLQQFVSSGNTLIAFSVIGGGMKALFGYGSYRERNDLRTLIFNDNELTRRFVRDPAEHSVNLADRYQSAGGVSYSDLAYPALAGFDDGAGAIIYNRVGNGPGGGTAYAIGFDFSHYILRAFNGRLTGVVDDYVNAYHPKVDSLLRFIAAAYQAGDDDAVELLSSPYNKEFTALITHDIDYTRSLANATEYASLESRLGVPATYFIQTKYLTDFNDRAFLSERSRSIVEQLFAAGMAVGSHSVAHSNAFSSLSPGSGQESYPQYRPFVTDFETVRNATISGELRVSKFILEHLGAGPVVSFRPGHLSLPRNLPELLSAHGYRYSSSITANEALTHYPYQTMFASEYGTETGIFEFPVTIEDEQGDLLSRLGQSIELANRIALHGGMVNLLIHTDETGRKLEFEKRFIEEFRERAWFATLPEFGQWWLARNSAAIEVLQPGPESKQLRIRVDGTINGLSLRLPDSWRLASPDRGTRQAGNVLIIDEITDSTDIFFDVLTEG